jgi:adiponectin receptor
MSHLLPGLRTTVFVALGLSAVFPVAHWALIRGPEILFRDAAFRWLVTSGALYILGALL